MFLNNGIYLIKLSKETVAGQGPKMGWDLAENKGHVNEIAASRNPPTLKKYYCEDDFQSVCHTKNCPAVELQRKAREVRRGCEKVRPKSIH